MGRTLVHLWAHPCQGKAVGPDKKTIKFGTFPVCFERKSRLKRGKKLKDFSHRRRGYADTFGRLLGGGSQNMWLLELSSFNELSYRNFFFFFSLDLHRFIVLTQQD